MLRTPFTLGRARWSAVAAAVAFLGSLVLATGSAQAVVVNDTTPGGTTAGVALVPGTRGYLPSGVSAAPSAPSCSDPWLSSDLLLPSNGLCYQGGSVMHGNETFDLSWDPLRRSWSTTRDYVEQFLRDVADGSGTFTSPYADTSQYSDAGGRARNASVYGGGCIDFGDPGGYTCRLGNTNGSGTGNNYPANGCTPTGQNQWAEGPGGTYGTPTSNDICLTDAQIQAELQGLVPQSGILGRTEPGYTPLVTLMTPPGVVVCLDSANKLCSANGTLPSQAYQTASFCSYHSEVNVGGTEVAYVVLPWVAAWDQPSPSSLATLGCDDGYFEQNPIPIPLPPVNVFATDVGQRLVSPLSQAQMAAMTNPFLNGWYALDGSEINDNGGCVPFGNGLDQATVGNSSQNPYYLQREFNNAGVIESDPNALMCTPLVNLQPTFVVPSAVNQGDVVEFDGSKTVSTLIVPKAGYQWSFGDGTTAVGPSVSHSYAKAGTYTVTLTVTDRGGYVASSTQTIVVLNPNGQPVTPPTTSGGGSTGGSGSGSHGSTPLQGRIQLLPQSLASALRLGVAVEVSSNSAAAGMAQISISRSAAQRAHIKAGSGRSVVIARGTISQVPNGSTLLRLHLQKATAAKLRKLRNVALTIHITLVAANGSHETFDAAGTY